jgi:hypothetical protein
MRHLMNLVVEFVGGGSYDVVFLCVANLAVASLEQKQCGVLGSGIWKNWMNWI